MYASVRLNVDNVRGPDGLLTVADPPTPHTKRWAFAARPRWHSRRPWPHCLSKEALLPPYAQQRLDRIEP